MNRIPVAYQMYSARFEAEKDLQGVLGQIAALGYDGVELAGLYGHSPQAVKAMLDELGLVAASSHVPLQAMAQNMFAVVAQHLTLGCDTLVLPYLEEPYRPGAPGFAQVLCTLYRFGEVCRAAGMRLLYHNHDFEFVPFGGMYALDFLFAALPPALVQTQIDTCWVKYAGEDPAGYIRKYRGRCPVIHLKDYVGEPGGQFEYRPLGYGCQDLPALVRAGIESGVQWFVVEQDDSPGRPPLEAAAMSMETLGRLGLK